jgi:hypothetical protein
MSWGIFIHHLPVQFCDWKPVAEQSSKNILFPFRFDSISIFRLSFWQLNLMRELAIFSFSFTKVTLKTKANGFRRKWDESGWPDEFVKQSPQNFAQPIFCPYQHTTITIEKTVLQLGLLTYVIFLKTAQSTRFPNRRKITQSGHPGDDP